LEHAPRHPDHLAVLADLDPELDRPAFGIPAGAFWNGDWETVPLALSCLRVRSDEEQRTWGGPGETTRRRASDQSDPDEVIE
jgi:hypothetical protein